MTGSTIKADLVVVGAGIAGLNALWVASQYLTKDQRVVLVDRHERVGGMWVNTYDYVRLHQPHPFFTTGDAKWTQGMAPAHLASKPEVLDHFAHCVDLVRQRVGVTELLGHELVGIEETGGGVQVACRAPDGSSTTVDADRVVDARSIDVQALQPLALSSERVRSVSPETCDLRSAEIAQSDAPVWIIGSGKTAMDSALTLITGRPGRQVNMLAGTGTFFFDREQAFPKGRGRWYRGIRFNKLFAAVAQRFDGTNEAEVMAWVRDSWGVQVTPHARHFFFGLLSQDEADRIRAGLGSVLHDHLVDVVDSGSEVVLRLRSGHEQALEPGSWIVNCTSHFPERSDLDYRPYVSPGGRVVTLGISGMFGFSSFAGYFLTHLLFHDKLQAVPFYQADLNALIGRSLPAAMATGATLSQYNLGLALDHLPARVFQQLGLDFDRWYPLPRRLAGQLQFMVQHKRRREHLRHSLDVVGQRFGIHCGPAGSVPVPAQEVAP